MVNRLVYPPTLLFFARVNVLIYVYACATGCIPAASRLYERFKKQFIRDFDNFYLISFKVTFTLYVSLFM